MKREVFLKPRFVGRRFEQHALPLDLLKDIAYLEPFFIEIAKWVYLKDHPERKRVPKGFADRVALKLTAVEDGSAIPHLALDYPQPNLMKPESVECFENARDIFIDTIDAAEKNQPLEGNLPSFLLSYFDKIGRSLEDDEYIEFNPTDQAKPARLNKEVRRRLIEASDKANDFTDERVLRGAIPEMDQEKMTFELQIIGGPRVKAPIEPQYLEEVLEAFNGYKQGIKVQIHGIVRLNRYEKIEKIESIDVINLLDPLDVSMRLDELRKMKDGWLDGEGVAPDREGLEWFETMMEDYYPEDLPLPYIYPTGEGNLQLEWDMENLDVSLEVDLSTHEGELHILNLTTEETTEVKYHLNDADGWNALIERLKELQEAADAK